MLDLWGMTETLWVTDAELIRRLGVPEKIASETIRMLDRQASSFPPKSDLWGGRRYWPAVRAYFDHHYGYRYAVFPSAPTESKHPKVENAPGLVWRRRLGGQWAAMWQARTDLIKAGFKPKTRLLWTGAQLIDSEASRISAFCHKLQDEMLLWGEHRRSTP